MDSKRVNSDEHRDGSGSVQSVDRAVWILKLLAERGSCRVTDLARELSLHKSGVHRMLTTLAGHGLAEQNPDTGKYRLGSGLVGLASAATSEIDIVRHARAPARRLSELTGETAIVTSLVEGQVMILHQVASSASVLGVSWSSQRMPLHCTPGGKILLAYLSQVEREELLSATLESFTQNTVVNPGALRRDLQRVRQCGYAYTLEELEVGLNGVAAPIRGPGGRAIAAIGIYGPAFRLPDSHMDEIGQLAVEAATEVSRYVGIVAEPTPHG